jgi:hypothetical protein
MVGRSRQTLPSVARVCLKRGNDAPVAAIGLVLKGSGVSPVQLRRATLYPAELRVRWASFSRLVRARQRPRGGGEYGSAAPDGGNDSG